MKHQKDRSLVSLFSAFVTEKHLFTKKNQFLLAVSGGVDSIAMFHLFRLKGYKFSVAHCNFKLRGRHSDKDEKFVRELCEEYAVTFYSRSFDTQTFSDDNGISLQMAARDLRYAWFSELMQKQSIDFLCTAHHENDSVETILLNLARGTGINGMTGIRACTGKLIRPLIFATKQQLESFVKLHGFKFRKDQSNEKLKYKRNLLRKKIIPLFEELNPSFISALTRTADHLSEVKKIVDKELDSAGKLALHISTQEASIDIAALNAFGSPSLLLYHLMSQLEIELHHHQAVMELLSSQSGRFLKVKDGVIIRDRDRLIISGSEASNADEVHISENETDILGTVQLHLHKGISDPAKTDADVIVLDYAALKFPLMVRSWKKGDKMIPFGMKGHKKISDLLIDLKISRNKKSKIRLLVNGDGKIIWVIGLKPDERFRLKKPNTESLIVKLLNPDYL